MDAKGKPGTGKRGLLTPRRSRVEQSSEALTEEAARTRRRFLEHVGKFAVVTPRAVSLRLASAERAGRRGRERDDT